MAGAPPFVFKSHFTNQCKKKGEYQQKLSGGAGSRQKSQKEFRMTEKELKMELKLLKKINKLKKKNFGGLKKKEEESDSSEGEDSEWSFARKNHGGEEFASHECEFKDVKINELNSNINVKTKEYAKNSNKKDKCEINLLDKLISRDAEAFLADEVHSGIPKRKRCELRAKSEIAASQRPTTVTLVNVRGG